MPAPQEVPASHPVGGHGHAHKSQEPRDPRPRQRPRLHTGEAAAERPHEGDPRWAEALVCVWPRGNSPERDVLQLRTCRSLPSLLCGGNVNLCLPRHQALEAHPCLVLQAGRAVAQDQLSLICSGGPALAVLSPSTRVPSAKAFCPPSLGQALLQREHLLPQQACAPGVASDTLMCQESKRLCF